MLGDIFSLAVFLQLAEDADKIYPSILERFDLNRVPCSAIYSSLLIASKYMNKNAKIQILELLRITCSQYPEKIADQAFVTML